MGGKVQRRDDADKNKKRNRRRKRPCRTAPVAPTNLTFVWDTTEKGRHRRVSVLLKWDEITANTSGAVDKAERYIVQMERSLDAGATTAGDPRRFLVAAKDDDANTTSSVEVRAVRKHTWYRYRVIAQNSDGCRSAWSAWTSWTLANDHNPPPSPLLVTVFAAAKDRIVIDWDPPLVYLPTEGTVSGTTGTATLTGVGTFFTVQAGVGTKIRVGAAGDIRTVTAIASDTSLTVDTNLSATVSAQVLYTEDPDPDVAFYDVWISKTSSTFAGSAYKRDRFVHATKKGIKVATADEGATFYARVRSIDASGNRSAWIPGTVAGNSAAGTTPDGIAIGAGGGGFIVAVFTKPGRLRLRHYPYRWVNETDYTLKVIRARAVIGIHDAATHPSDGCPTGANANVHVWRWSDADDPVKTKMTDIDSRLLVSAGTHRDTSNSSSDAQTSWTLKTVAPGESISIEVAQVGSTFPGEDMTVSVYLTP